ncbi:hypothetical protein GM921_01060 [Pedobacter sp. LMG 31464]|uniref:Uncharacterized protein n=1 Tax=Pedobacter planticolens TaxID=2679964 RepID=A0A923ITS1_9SPHI|nr:hypothetical protein [Pedobacter planticolens]MBB2144061.1 hypothetical protein [Pedobacter planticolens]
MKKLTLILICIASLGLASCKKDTIVQSANNLTIIKYIEANQWQSSADGFTLSASLSDNRIDDRTFEDDGILVYISRNDGNFYEQLPFVYDVQSYSYTVSKGRIDIDIQSSDFQSAIPDKPTTRTRVKIVLIESSQ